MVVRMWRGKNPQQDIGYSEKKCEQQKANLLHASGFLIPTDRLKTGDITRTFDLHNALNTRTKVNMLHITLNFHKDDKLTSDMLIQITDEYMGGIGFADQPYVVFEHKDASHPHLHINTTIIDASGKSISIHNLGKTKSETMRKKLELKYGLIQAEGRRLILPLTAHLPRLKNTQHPIAASMDRILAEVFANYLFHSLPELNAVLSLYNIRLQSTSDQKGMICQALSDGNPAGKPVNASDLLMKPTHSQLQKLLDEKQKQIKLTAITARRIESVLLNKPSTIEEFTEILKQKRIALIIRQNEEQRIYGLTYIDLQTKTVINGRNLGKHFAANPILDLLSKNDRSVYQIAGNPVPLAAEPKAFNYQTGTNENILESLLDPEWIAETLPFTRKKKKKRKNKK